MVKKYLFTLFTVLISLALSGAFSYSYSAAPMGSYCQTPPVVASAVQPNIMITQDVSGSMSWCGYFSQAGQNFTCTPSNSCTLPISCTQSSSGSCQQMACDPNCTCSVSQNACASTADCGGGTADTCPSSCGYISTTTYDGYFNPSKFYDQDSNLIWQEWTSGSTCKVVPSKATCYTTQTNYNNSCVLKGSTYGSGAYPGAAACSLIPTCNKSGNYCCATDTTQSGNCGSASGNFLNYMHMHRIDMLRWAMTGGTPASCTSTNAYKPLYCDAEQWQTATATGQVGAACTGSVSGTGCCGVNNLLNGDSVYQSGCVLKTADGFSVKVPWRRINGSCSIGSSTNVTPALCTSAGGLWTTSGGLAYTFMTLPVVPRMGLLAFEDTGPVDGVYIGDYTATGSTTNDPNSISLSFPYQNLISHINSIPPQNGTPTGPALWDVYNYFQQNTPKYTDSGSAVASFKGLTPQTSTSSTDIWRNPMYDCGTGGTNCVFVPCAGNYVILMSDGGWNTPSCSISGSTSCTTATNADPVVPAYCMHNTFLNTKSSMSAKVNSVYTISLFPSSCSISKTLCQSTSNCTGGTGNTCVLGYGGTALENVSMYGSFNNSQKTWPGSLTGFPATSCTDSVDCSSSAQGSLCTALPASSPDWDANVDGIPDTAYTAVSASQIKSGILTAVQSILQQSTSGTAASILATGQGSGANLVQAVFYPLKPFADANVSWIGEMQNLWYYIDPKLQVNSIRDDTVHDWILELKQDNVIVFNFDTSTNQTVANLFTDATGTGNPVTFRITEPLAQVNNLWEAGTMLWSRNLTSLPRTLYTSTTGSSLTNFSTTNASTLQNYLQASSTQEATNLINYTSGIDVQYCSISMNTCTSNANCTGGSGDTCTAYRPRTAALSTTAPNNTDKVWKLGDVISSTPIIESWIPLNTYYLAYHDQSYYQYIQSLNYTQRGEAYAGANDGMLHAFNFGLLSIINSSSDQFKIAQLTNNSSTLGLGDEQWAYIPKNSLPYLRYLASPNYCHLFYVDGASYLFDASINAPSGCLYSDYSLCTRQTKCQGNPVVGNVACQATGAASTNTLDLTNTSWRTIVIGYMGTGGACRQTAGSCSVKVCSQHSGTTCTANSNCPNYSTGGETCLPACVLAPTTDPFNTANSLGYSTYFALDVTTPTSPALLWEFSDPGLGFSTAGPAVVRVNGNAPASTANSSTNGKWFVVLASGPTGPIDPASYQFLGSSDQHLMLYILDLKTGALLRTIDTGLTNAFAGSMLDATIDTDSWNSGSTGAYEDNVIYIPYTQLSGGSWVGGVLRLTTGGSAGEDSNVNNWKLSTVITVPGAVTASVSHVQDFTNHKLWLFFGTGRYFYKIGSTIDDANTQQYIYGIKDPCYSDSNVTPDTYDMSCTSSVSVSGLNNSTTTPPSTEAATGWYIKLDGSGTTYMAERVVTNPIGAFTGAVFFPSFEPSSTPCGFSGNTFLWAVNYNTGGSPPAAALQGMALIQVSTGQVEQVSMSTAFSDKVPSGGTQGRRSLPFTGLPPKGKGLSVVTSPPPVKKILHMQQK